MTKVSDLNKSLLKVNNLSVSFDTTEGSFDAVKSINFDLKKGETLAIIGESGSGKSVTASISLMRPWSWITLRISTGPSGQS